MTTENENPLTQKIAVYRALSHDWVHVARYYGEMDHTYHTGMVRISEPHELTFAPLANEAVVRNALETLDGMELAAREELETKLNQIRGQREQLRALVYQPEATI